MNKNEIKIKIKCEENLSCIRTRQKKKKVTKLIGSKLI